VNSRNTYAAEVEGGRRDGGIDQELLQQTVQAVVVAVTAASNKNVGNATAEVNAPNTVVPNSTQTVAAQVMSSVGQPAAGQSGIGVVEDGATMAKKKKT
jgi:hypothetical protein